MKCERRKEVYRALVEDVEDTWGEDNTCSYCGSLNPDEVFKRIEAGEEIIPTDKSYKIYISPGHKKFYFQHFNEDEKKRFVDIYNKFNVMKFGFPGNFYVWPFFMRPEPIEEDKNNG